MAATDGRSPAVVDVDVQRRRRVDMAIAKLKDIADGVSATKFGSEDYIETYTAIYDLCNATKEPPNNAAALYALYRRTLEDYLASTVVPSLLQKQGEVLLRELLLRWSNHKAMVRRLSACFAYVDRFHVLPNVLPTLGEVGLDCFRTSVFQEFIVPVADAMVDLKGQERELGEIYRTLMMNLFDFFSEIFTGVMQ